MSAVSKTYILMADEGFGLRICSDPDYRVYIFSFIIGRKAKYSDI